ncbi:hypothetical protein [Yersinia phage vB_YenM_P744]
MATSNRGFSLGIPLRLIHKDGILISSKQECFD